MLLTQMCTLTKNFSEFPLLKKLKSNLLISLSKLPLIQSILVHIYYPHCSLEEIADFHH